MPNAITRSGYSNNDTLDHKCASPIFDTHNANSALNPFRRAMSAARGLGDEQTSLKVSLSSRDMLD
jgi:hypothetical protein